MSNYTKITDFAAKDALPLNNAAKYVKGTEIGAEFDAIATAVATKADTNSPALVTPDIGAATGTTLVLSGDMTATGVDSGSAFPLGLMVNGNLTTSITASGTPTAYVKLIAYSSGQAEVIAASSGLSNVPLYVSSKGTGSIDFRTASTVPQVKITNTASADRWLTLTGSNGAAPTIGTSEGDLNLSSASGLVKATGNFVANGYSAMNLDDALPAGGSLAVGMFLTNAFIAVIAGSGPPTVVATKGSLYLRSDGSTTNDRMYVATDGVGGWTAVITAA